MMRYFREDLHRRLLSADFKKQVDGLEILQKVLFFLILSKLCAFQLLTVLLAIQSSIAHRRHFHPLLRKL